jgi:hypothetical protein
MAIRDKWKKVSAGLKKSKPTTTTTSSTVAHAPHVPTSTPTREAKQREKAVAVKTMSMMTPDMLETLGLNELSPPNYSLPGSPTSLVGVLIPTPSEEEEKERDISLRVVGGKAINNTRPMQSPTYTVVATAPILTEPPKIRRETAPRASRERPVETILAGPPTSSQSDYNPILLSRERRDERLLAGKQANLAKVRFEQQSRSKSDRRSDRPRSSRQRRPISSKTASAKQQQRQQLPLAYIEAPGCITYFADNNCAATKASSNSFSSSSTTSTSEETYESFSRDPCPCSDLLYGDNDVDDDQRTSTSSILAFYRETAETANCSNPVACATMAVALPVACGLLCVDNVAGTHLFERATKSHQIQRHDSEGSSPKAKSRAKANRHNAILDDADEHKSEKDTAWLAEECNAVCYL